MKVSCHSCQLVRIQGVVCHEIGCNESYKDELRECSWCGQDFKPEDRYQKLCSEGCYCSYNGLSEPEEIDAELEVSV